MIEQKFENAVEFKGLKFILKLNLIVPLSSLGHRLLNKCLH